MGLVTIVSDELSKEEVKNLQEEANKLADEHNYNAHKIMHHFGLNKNISVSLYTKNGQITMNCHKAAVAVKK